MRRRRHWYFISYFGCPVCGSGRTYRERRYGRKPKSYWKRHEQVEVGNCSRCFG